MQNDVIFEPLQFRNLRVKNRIFRSNISGRFDNYDGTGTQTRINWEESFAKGGVGAILSSYVPVHLRGRIMPNYAMIDSDDKIPFWRAVGEAVHRHDCKYILQLSHSGRQRDNPGVENFKFKALSSTSRMDTFHGLLCEAMTLKQIRETIQYFASGARRAREAGLDGVELHASHGYLITQFLSSAINDRKDEYGGSLRNRAAFLLEIIAAIRKEVGDDFHLQAKLNAVDFANALYPWEKKGNTLDEGVEVAKWAEVAGVDAIHVSIGSIFPHPLLPPGGFPPDELNWWYGTMIASGVRGYFNYTMFHFRFLRPIFSAFWERTKKDHPVEAVSSEYCKVVKKNISVPVINTGGYQDARVIRRVIAEGYTDAVSIARPLVANRDLPHILRTGHDLPEKPCSFCNRCLVNAIANPLGCYDVRRFNGDQEAMVAKIMEVFHPEGVAAATPAGEETRA
jgi:2,4-dienoyl-CoA reductase-like NADH-dependent reductase (Old Yellow Enzyme family)